MWSMPLQPKSPACIQKNTQTKWSTLRQAAYFVLSCLEMEHSTSSIQLIISDVGETKLAIPATTSEDLKSSHTVQDWRNLFNHSRKINLNPCHWHCDCVNTLAVCPDSMQNTEPSTIIPVSTSDMDNGHAQIYMYTSLHVQFMQTTGQSTSLTSVCHMWWSDGVGESLNECLTQTQRVTVTLSQWVTDTFIIFIFNYKASLTLCVCVSGGYIFILLAVGLMSQFFAISE